MSVTRAATVTNSSSRSASQKDGPELRVVSGVKTDRSRDALLTEFGKVTLEDRYLLPGESYQDMFARVARAYSDDLGHAGPVEWRGNAWLADIMFSQSGGRLIG